MFRSVIAWRGLVLLGPKAEVQTSRHFILSVARTQYMLINP